MRGAVEAVAADLVLLIILVGQGINIALGGHRLMEGGVEHGHHGGGGHNGLAGLDAGDVGGIVQGGQRDALLQGGHHVGVDPGGGGKLLAAVDHPVAHRVDLGHAPDHAVLGGGQGVQHGLDGLSVGGHGNLKLQLQVLGGDLVGQAAVDADALTQALGQHRPGVGVHELVLQRGTARIDDEDFHVTIRSLICIVWASALAESFRFR